MDEIRDDSALVKGSPPRAFHQADTRPPAKPPMAPNKILTVTEYPNNIKINKKINQIRSAAGTIKSVMSLITGFPLGDPISVKKIAAGLNAYTIPGQSATGCSSLKTI